MGECYPLRVRTSLKCFEPYEFVVICCCRSQHWRQKFVDLALIWMEVFGKQISKWVVTAVAQDQVNWFAMNT